VKSQSTLNKPLGTYGYTDLHFLSQTPVDNATPWIHDWTSASHGMSAYAPAVIGTQCTYTEGWPG